jgi:hypothetical protein
MDDRRLGILDRYGGSDPAVVDATAFSITIEDEVSTGDPLITA